MIGKFLSLLLKIETLRWNAIYENTKTFQGALMKNKQYGRQLAHSYTRKKGECLQMRTDQHIDTDGGGCAMQGTSVSTDIKLSGPPWRESNMAKRKSSSQQPCTEPLYRRIKTHEIPRESMSIKSNFGFERSSARKHFAMRLHGCRLINSAAVKQSPQSQRMYLIGTNDRQPGSRNVRALARVTTAYLN